MLEVTISERKQPQPDTTMVPSTKTRLRLDPWPGDYDSGIPLDEAEVTDAQVDTRVEHHDWTPVNPVQELAGSVYFVDGVRRVEARVLLDQPGVNGLTHGLFGSLATGAVRCGGNAAFDSVVVKRIFVLGQGIERAECFQIGSMSLAFDPYPVSENTPASSMAGLQNQMRTEEAELGESLAGTGACVFADGPLTYFSDSRHSMAGVIKRIVQPYLGPADFALVERLRIGQRTPLFALRDGKSDRYSWYLRVAEGRRVDHPLAGVLRVEMRAAAGIERAKQIADGAARLFPAFASTSARDPRAPQNLLPVGALEDELRRRLGDTLSIRRAIERKLHEYEQ
jgi:hypothetical protein